MVQYSHIIKNVDGLHARPASKLAMLALKQPCSCFLQLGSQRVDATRLMEIMGLPARQGDTLTVTCDGDNEQNALEQFIAVLDSQL
ncbi:MAG: HPr family phosphocarrier protein [Oscillospiraceae bacterium]